MKEIEAFVDSVYQNVGGNKKEIQELKDEMKGHLLEAVHELKLEGKSEQEAIEISIERFGGEKEMRSIVGQLFKAQKVFAKRVLHIALTFFVLTTVVCGVLWALDQVDMKENDAVAEIIIGILEGKETVSKDAKEEIDTLVQNKNQILNLKIYKMSDVEKVSETGTISYHLDEATPVYRIGKSPSDEKKWMLIDLGYMNDTEWYVQMESITLFAFVPFISLIGFAIYATLFTIWATINAYHHKRLNVGWVIAFAFLNVVGYLIYFLVGKKVPSKTIS
ncbi:permease prefix domain 1-containing protein [Peribacillus simplex]|uniref:permease prefix domain 1-containing protein n=1 Tax=Peribacillus simplex TaxID=1478 RepID=UPI0025A0D9CA|nr:permease prefix domain 1-containing protein [Peribacillus simplex]MDM5291869.1 permease prefix domain 1-containing protein [Peribacillus simplex]